jgi:hypothetical protein
MHIIIVKVKRIIRVSQKKKGREGHQPTVWGHLRGTEGGDMSTPMLPNSTPIWHPLIRHPLYKAAPYLLFMFLWFVLVKLRSSPFNWNIIFFAPNFK